MEHGVAPHEVNHSESIIEFLDANGNLEDPTQRRDYFSHLEDNDFLDLVQQIEGLVRTGKLENQYFDGKTLCPLRGREAPDQRDKEQLLRNTWTVARNFLNDTSLSDREALDYAALTAAGGLIIIHPFTDGNGRASRTLSYMIAYGNNNSQELHDILAKHEGVPKWVLGLPLGLKLPISPYDTHYSEGGRQPEDIEWKSDLVDDIESENDVYDIIANSWYNSKIVRRFIKEHSDTVAVQLGQSLLQNGSLDGDAFVSNLVNDPDAGMTNAQELLDMHREVRADYLLSFLQVMESDMRFIPDRIFRSKVRKELASRAVNGYATWAECYLAQHYAYSQLRHENNKA